jgi:hypothetical protein
VARPDGGEPGFHPEPAVAATSIVIEIVQYRDSGHIGGACRPCRFPFSSPFCF